MAKLIVATTIFILSAGSACAEDFHKFQIIFSADDNLCQRINNHYNSAMNDTAIVKRYVFNGDLERVDVNNDNTAELVYKRFGLLSGHETQSLEVYANNQEKAYDCVRAEDRLSKRCKDVLIGFIPREDVYLKKLPMQNRWAKSYIEIGPYIVIDILDIDGQNYVTISRHDEQFNIKGSNWIIFSKYDINLNPLDICYILDEYFIRPNED